jgi:putative solute:sodium symporter small subunit
MQNALHVVSIRSTVETMVVRLDRHFSARLKRAMLAMLAAWLGYFSIISLTARMLNKVAVPLLGTPLGFFLVVQGTLVIFFTALILLVKASSLAGRSR